MMNSLNYQLAGMINQTNAAASTGDISHGNTQLLNHSFNNVNGNKYDTTTLLRQHGTTIQDSSGLETKHLPNDTRVYNTAPMASNFQWQVASNSQYSEAVQDLHTAAQSNLTTEQAGFTTSHQTGTQMLADWRTTSSSTEGYGLNHGHGATANAMKGIDSC